MNRKWIDDQFNMVNFRVGIFRPEVNKFYLEPTGQLYEKLSNGSDDGLQETTDILVKHLCITAPVTAKYEWGITMAEDTAGQIQGCGLAFNIKIPFKYVGNKYAIGAILVHEVSHAFLAEKGIILHNKQENEMLTDISAIAFGLGKLTLNGLYADIDSDALRSHLSYLSTDLMTYCFKKTARFRGIPQSVIRNYLVQPAAIAVSE